MPKRDKLEIIYDILRTIQKNRNSIKPTPLLRYANLSYNSFTNYYEELLDKGFVRENLDKDDRKYISLTDKGFRFIDKFEKIKGFIEEFEL